LAGQSAGAPNVYFATQTIRFNTLSGPYDYHPGSRFVFVQPYGADLLVQSLDTHVQMVVSPSCVTNDPEVARQAWRGWMREQGLLAQYEQQQRETAREVEQKKRDASNGSATPAPNKPFFDDPNYKSIFDRDRERAQKDEQEQVQRASEKRLAEIIAKQAQKDARKTRSQESQAQSDAQMSRIRAKDAKSRIQDLESQVDKVRRDKMYEYNKAATEKGGRDKDYYIEEAAKRKIDDLEGKINDARQEQSHSEIEAQPAEQH
jgi:hypothetical protein